MADADADPIVDLETSLQARWDPDTAAVYADLLASRGDPRGELIAIDLELTRREADELRERKREILSAWLGAETIGDWTWHPRNFQFGLLCDFGVATTSKRSMTEHLQILFDSPIGTAVRGLTLYGGVAELDQVIDAIAERPLPWLRRLVLQRTDSRRPIGKARWSAFVEATPHLEELAVLGKRVVASPVHPGVRTLRLVGGDAITIGREPIASVATLDLAFEEPDSWEPAAAETHAALAALVNPRTFPGLRALDLSRNGPRRYGDGPGPIDSIPPFLAAVERLDRIERLRLPAIRDDAAAAVVLELLARFPRLSIEIARMYVVLEGFAHERLSVPPPRPWPVPGTVHGRDALTIKVPGVQYGDELALSSIVRGLEDQFDDMRADARAAWEALWSFLDDLGWEDEAGDAIKLPFDGATLLLALEALDGDGRCDTVAKMIRDAKLAPGTSVTIKRYWGW